MSEELKLKPCLRCRKDVSVIHAHGCKFIRCDCGIQSSRYGEHIADWRMVADWNFRPIEDSQAVRIAELEKMAEARKLANRLLEQERNELEAERDRLREALVKLKECLEGYFGKTEKDFFEDCNEDSGELYFADVYNVAVNALKKARGEA